MTKKNVLVTGGTGCIGHACLSSLDQSDLEIHAITRNTNSTLPPPRESNKTPEVNWHEHDLLDLPSIQSMVEELRPDYLLHCAWHTEPGNWQRAAPGKFIPWVGATMSLIDSFYSSGGTKAVCVGSGTEYEWSQGGVFNEESPRSNPASFYGQTKASTCDLATSYAENTGVPFAWARLFFMYGGNEDAKRLVPSVILSLLQKQHAKTSDGHQIRDYLYVEDVANALTHILLSEFTGAINVGAGTGVTLKEIITTIGDLLDRPDLLQLGALPRAPGDTEQVIADTSKLAKLGFTPSFDLQTGLQSTIDFWRTQLEIKS